MTNDTRSFVNIGLQTENQLDSIKISAPEMIGLSVEFVEETHSLGARILNELNKVKQLTAPNKLFFRDAIARLKDFVVRQHAWLVYLSEKTSQRGSSITGKRVAKAKKRKVAPRSDDSPKEEYHLAVSFQKSSERRRLNGRLSCPREKGKKC